MNISPAQSGYQLIQQSNRLTEQAAQEINSNNDAALATLSPASTNSDTTQATLPQSVNANESMNGKRDDYVEPLIKLQQADQYSKVGANIIQREQAMIGSLLDTRV